MSEEKLPKVEIRTDGIHGKSLFAGETIKKGQKVIEYVGEKITKAEAERRIEEIDKVVAKSGRPSEYFIFELNKRYDIDGDVSHNIAKYINHSCEPNCEIDIINNRIWVIALREIKKGEELNYDYAWEFDEDDFETRPCNCGSKKCVGFILCDKEWKKLKKHYEKKGMKVEAEKVEKLINQKNL